MNIETCRNVGLIIKEGYRIVTIGMPQFVRTELSFGVKGKYIGKLPKGKDKYEYVIYYDCNKYTKEDMIKVREYYKIDCYKELVAAYSGILVQK